MLDYSSFQNIDKLLKAYFSLSFKLGYVLYELSTVKWSLVIIEMPVLPCPMGARCTDGEDGATWKSVDIAFEQAQALVADHVRFAHQNVAAGAAPAQLKAEKLTRTS